MKTLLFISLDVEHFRSFGKRQTLPLDMMPGLWFLRGENLVEPQLGSNGSGKSSLWGALCWVLYGRTAQGLRNPDIKPWTGKGVPRVRLTLSVDDEPFIVERTTKTNGITINDNEATQEDILALIGLSFEAFTNTLYLPQGLPLFLDRTPRDKMQLFTEVLNLERWEERSKAASARARELSGLESEMTGELSGLNLALDANTKLMEQARAASKDWEDEKAEQAKSAGADIKKLQAELAVQQKELDTAVLKNEAAWIKLREMRADVNSLRKIANDSERQYQDEQSKYAGYQRELDELTQEVLNLAKAKNCPTCGQPVKKHDVAAHREELKEQVADLALLIEEGPDGKLKALADGAIGALKNFETDLAKTEQVTDETQARVNMLQPNVSRLLALTKTAQDAKDRAETEANPYSEQVQTLRQQKKTLEAKLQELEDDILKAQKQIERTKFWVKGFKDVALYLIEEVLSELEAVTNVTLGEVGLVGWEMRYDMERETKSGTVQRGVTVMVIPPADYIDTKGKASPIKWESWSGGEEQRLRLVGAIALSDVLLRHAGIASSLEVFDEPAKYVSGAGVADICDYLRARAKSQDKTIFFIDHLAKEAAVFEGTLTVQKTAEGSVISDFID